MPRGALLLHGFTATPECLESLARPLKKAGFVVEAPLLAGHGTTARELAQTTWRQWYESVLEGYDRLAKKVDSVCVAGLSLGGVLSLKLATERKVRRLALMATPVIFKGFVMETVLPIVATSFLKEIYRYQPKFFGPAINDPKGKRTFKSYTKMPVQSIMEIVRLQKEVRPRLKEVTVPTLILHSPHDTTAPYENMAYLKEHLGARTIKAVTLKRSNHVLTLDYEKELVACEVVKFFGGGNPDKSGPSNHGLSKGSQVPQQGQSDL